MSDLSGLSRSLVRLWQAVTMAAPPSPLSISWQGSVEKFTKILQISMAAVCPGIEKLMQERDGEWAAYFPSVLSWNPRQVLKDYLYPSWHVLYAPCLCKSHSLLHQNLCEQVGRLTPCGSPRPWTPLPEAQPVANTPKIRLYTIMGGCVFNAGFSSGLGPRRPRRMRPRRLFCGARRDWMLWRLRRRPPLSGLEMTRPFLELEAMTSGELLGGSNQT